MNCRCGGSLPSSGEHHASKPQSASHAARGNSCRRPRCIPCICAEHFNRSKQGRSVLRRRIGLPEPGQRRNLRYHLRHLRHLRHIAFFFRYVRFLWKQRAAQRLGQPQVRSAILRRKFEFRFGKNVFGRFLCLSGQAGIGNRFVKCIGWRQRRLRRRKDAFRLARQQQVSGIAIVCWPMLAECAVIRAKQWPTTMRSSSSIPKVDFCPQRSCGHFFCTFFALRSHIRILPVPVAH